MSVALILKIFGAIWDLTSFSLSLQFLFPSFFLSYESSNRFPRSRIERFLLPTIK